MLYCLLAQLPMVVSLYQQAMRPFVKVLLTLARVYKIALAINRDASEKDLTKAYKRVALKAHPDKGGSDDHFKTLQASKEKWETLRATKADRPDGRRWAGGADAASTAPVGGNASQQLEFRVRGCSVLLTYHGLSDQASWKDFLDFVRGSLELRMRGSLVVRDAANLRNAQQTVRPSLRAARAVRRACCQAGILTKEMQTKNH